MGLLCELFIVLQWIFQDPGEGGHPPGRDSRVSGTHSMRHTMHSERLSVSIFQTISHLSVAIF